MSGTNPMTAGRPRIDARWRERIPARIDLDAATPEALAEFARSIDPEAEGIPIEDWQAFCASMAAGGPEVCGEGPALPANPKLAESAREALASSHREMANRGFPRPPEPVRPTGRRRPKRPKRRRPNPPPSHACPRPRPPEFSPRLGPASSPRASAPPSATAAAPTSAPTSTPTTTPTSAPTAPPAPAPRTGPSIAGSIPANARVAVIGDSHMAGDFGRAVKGKLQGHLASGGGELQSFTGVPSAGVSNFLRGTPTKAGDQTYQTPNIDSVLAKKPDTLVVGLGSNQLGGTLKDNKRQTHALCDKADAAGSKVVWVGPPNMRGYGGNLKGGAPERRFYDALQQVNTERKSRGKRPMKIVDSRPATREDQTADSVHFTGARAQAWADHAFGTPSASTSPSASVNGPKGASAVNQDEAMAALRKRHPISLGDYRPEIQSDTKDLQTHLKKEGLYSGEVTGKFDRTTEQAVRKFQEQRGLKVDGIVGQQTWGAIHGVSVEPGCWMLKGWAKSFKGADNSTVYRSANGGGLRDKAIERHGQGFIDKLDVVSSRLGVQPEWLLKVMNSESGLDHRARNKMSNATGLIQWMPSTAKQFGTSVDELRNMSATQQLDYVERYFGRWNGRLKSATDVYSVVFYPNVVGKSDGYVLGSERSQDWAQKVGRQNRCFDTDRDGVITAAEFRNFCARKFGEPRA